MISGDLIVLCFLLLITSTGNHTLMDGRSGVLQKEIKDYITNELQLKADLVVGNAGMLQVHLGQV